MPCNDYWGPGHSAEPELRERLDRVTALLCEVMKCLATTGLIVFVSRIPDLLEWWEEHQKLDAQRNRDEKARRLKQLLEKEIQEAAEKTTAAFYEKYPELKEAR